MDAMMLLAGVGGLGVAGLGWFLLRRWPQAGVVGWCVVVAFVPVWWAVKIGTDWRPASLFAIVLLASMVGRLPRRWNLADLGLGILFLAAAFPALVGGATASTLYGVFTQWVLGFLIGRALLGVGGAERVYRTLAITFGIVGALAIVEFLSDFHLWKLIGPHNSLYALWGDIQYRGGLPRSEGAFGHSIALACSIAMAVPLVFAARFKVWVQVLLLALMGGGILFTFSRTGMVSAALALLVVAFVGGVGVSRKSRNVALVTLLAGAAMVLPFLTRVLFVAGDEAEGSANYRTRLLDLVASMQMVGMSPMAQTNSSGENSFGGFKSIDSQIVLTGLSYGWLVLGIGLVLLAAACIVVVRGRGSPSMIAVVGQIPALLTVATITQYGILFWFYVGMAVAESQRNSDLQPGLDLLGSASESPLPGLAKSRL